MERRSNRRVSFAEEIQVKLISPKKPRESPSQDASGSGVGRRSVRRMSAPIKEESPVGKVAIEKATPQPKEKKSTPTPKEVNAGVAVASDNEGPSTSRAMPTLVRAPLPKPASTPRKEVQEAVVTPESVMLNSRGMPQRQRKPNRFYVDDMVTPDTHGNKRIVPKMKIKEEPLDDEPIPGEPSELAVAEVEVRTSAEIPSPEKRGKYTKKVYSTIPTAVQLAQAVTQMVKPRVSNAGRPPKVEKKRGTKHSEGVPRKYEKTSTHSKSSRGHSHAGKIHKSSISKTNKASYSYDSDKPGPSGVKVKYTGKGSAADKPYKRTFNIKPDPDADEYRKSRNETLTLHSFVDVDDDRRHQKDMTHYKRAHKTRKTFSPDSFQEETVNIDSERPSLDKKTAHEISLRLRNLLKLPKAHKWVCYEWFYSNIDKVLFEGENDFQICFKESFPQLKTRKLTRVEWTKLRRLMGKPRRCSHSFFEEEREELSRRRQKIRMIQQRKLTDFNYKELPDEIPLQLVIGTKVTTRLRKPQDGLFTGTIEGVDTSNNTYRIRFEDRPGLGTHSIPDYEVLSNEPPETVSTSSFALKIPRRSVTANQFKLNTALGDEMNKFGSSPFPVDGMLGGFPIRLLDMIVRLSKLLKSKREKILQLKELNVEAEKLKSYNKPYNDDFRLRYARVILDLESMNKEIVGYLGVVEQYCVEIAPDHGANQMLIPQQVKENSDQEAVLIVHTYNTKQGREAVQSSKGLSLISGLVSLMLQVKSLSSGERNLFELRSIKDSMAEMKATLTGKNLQLFQDKIEIPMNRIQAGLTYRHGSSKQ